MLLHQTILLVEDDEIVALLERKQLEQAGYKVRHAPTGETAITVIAQERISVGLVLMDIDLGPGMDGTLAAQEILKIKDIPIVFLSAHTEPEVVEKTEKITFYGYVVKNSGITVLDASIKMAIKLHSANQALELQRGKLEETTTVLRSLNAELASANAQLQKTQGDLRNGEKRYRALFENMPAAFALHEMIYDAQGRPVDYRFLIVNGAFEDMTGLRGEDVLGQNAKSVIPSLEEYWIHTYGLVASSGVPIAFQHYSNGLGRWFDVRAYSPQSRYFATVFTDITEKRVADLEIYRLNRMYGLTRDISRAFFQCTDSEALMKEACRIAVEVGGFRMAWVGLVDPASHVVRPASWAGHEDAYLSVMKQISALDVPEGRGPTGQSIRDGKYYYCNDIATDIRMIPWREEALKRRYRSSIALPLRVAGEVIGSFTIYAEEPNRFDANEIALLVDVSDAMAYALHALEIQARCTALEAAQKGDA